jgi:SAM-dependent methyltransferase
MTANADQIDYWNEVAGAKWVANQARLDRLMAPLADALIDGAAAKRGERILDIGCGCGDVSLRLAESIGAAGHVTGLDISAPMLAHAAVRLHASTPGDRAPVSWLQADAMTHSFEPDHDLLVSRFGVMFFDDPPRAFANLGRAMKPGARFAFLTWRRRPEVEWMQTPLEWMAPLLPIPPETIGAIGPFGLADSEATCRMMTAAGFRSVSVDAVDCSLTIGAGATDAETVDDAFTLLTNAGAAANSLREADPDMRSRASGLLRDGLQARVTNGRVTMGGACWLYRGRV